MWVKAERPGYFSRTNPSCPPSKEFHCIDNVCYLLRSSLLPTPCSLLPFLEGLNK
ncbi:hypothetical protein [Moorena producens]|uniref:hypothetical protein n=1 Tax=Moorena producens TaxID=1155739 RepID=UPI003C710A7D